MGTAMHHFGRDIAGADGVDGDALGGVLLRQRLGEADVASLRGRIIGLAHLALLAIDRRDVDDPAEAALAHAFDHRTAHVEQGIEVGVDDVVPLVRRHLVEHAVFGDSGVVDENIDRPEVLGDLGQPSYTVLVFGDVPFVDVDARLRLELGGGLVVGMIGRRDLAARRLQRLGDGGADAARAAGDHCDSSHVSSRDFLTARVL